MTSLNGLLVFIVVHPWDAFGRLCAALAVYAAIYAIIKGAFQKVTGRAAKGGAWVFFDVLAEIAMNLPGAVNRGVRASGGESIFAPPAGPKPSAVREGQSGRASLVAIACVALLGAGTGAAIVCCGPRPVPVDGGPAVTPSSWTDTARVVVTTLRWALPAAKAITDITVAEPGRTQVARALDATAQAAGRMEEAIVAYERAGGDNCLAKSATAGVHTAIVVLAQTLADNGIALGTTIERVADGLASVVDVLTPACPADASLSASAGDASNQVLREIGARARSRGVTLSRVLDNLRPLDGGVAR